MTILGIVGSLRAQSYNRQLLEAFKKRAPEGVALDIAGLEGIPLYNQDDEAGRYPAAAQALKDRIRAADGVLIAAPEYLRSVPGVLKNAIDWTTRPHGASPWAEKPVGVMGATRGPWGTVAGQTALKGILLYLGCRIMGQPEFYAADFDRKIGAQGSVVDEQTLALIDAFWTAFAAHARQ